MPTRGKSAKVRRLPSLLLKDSAGYTIVTIELLENQEAGFRTSVELPSFISMDRGNALGAEVLPIGVTTRNLARPIFLVVLLLGYRCFRSMEKAPRAPLWCNSDLPGQECHGSTPRCVVWPIRSALSEALMGNRYLLLLGLFLGSLAPAVAQTPGPWKVLAQERVAPIITTLPTISTPLPAASFLLSKGEKSNARFSLMFAGAYKRDQGLEHLSPMNEVKTLTLTWSTLPLIQLCRGRLQLDAFQSTLHIRDALFNPFGQGGMQGSHLPGYSYLGAPPSLNLSGLNLGFYFGRNAQTGDPARSWRRLPRILGAVLN